MSEINLLAEYSDDEKRQSSCGEIEFDPNEKMYVFTIAKCQLDKANKDHSSKYPAAFKVSLYFEPHTGRNGHLGHNGHNGHHAGDILGANVTPSSSEGDASEDAEDDNLSATDSDEEES